MHHSRQDSNLQCTIHFSGVCVSRATGTQTSVRQSCKHTRVLSGTLHGEAGAGSREDTEMAGPAWPASEDNPSKLHSHQKILHLRMQNFGSSSGCHLTHQHAACGSAIPLSAPKTQGREPCGRQEEMEGNPGWKQELGHTPHSPLSTTKPTLTSSMQRITRSHTMHNSELMFPSIEKVWEKKQGMSLFLREYPCSVVKIRQAEEEVARELLERSRDEWEANSF